MNRQFFFQFFFISFLILKGIKKKLYLRLLDIFLFLCSFYFIIYNVNKKIDKFKCYELFRWC